MKLTRVQISNYRSIENINLEFKHGCQALIGINESGKSNILKALRLIDPQAPVDKSDVRIERKGEEEISFARVQFHFALEPQEIEPIVTSTLQLFETSSASEVLCTTYNSSPLTPAEFCAERCRGLYEIQLPENKRTTNYFGLAAQQYTLASGWFFNPTDQPFTVPRAEKPPVQVPAKGYAKFSEPVPAPLVAADVAMVNDFIGSKLKPVIAAKLPKCIFWQYKDEYLLPGSVNIDAFVANPATCVPLQSMFELAGYRGPAIGAAITKARSTAPHRYIQLLRKVQDAATTHVRDVWKDHKNVRIELQPDGTSLHPIVCDDSVPLDMANRSDGFKRFVSFLLQVSAKARSNQLDNVVLLIDEPEIALHPAGARNLTQELIAIGATTPVVYSTHSIFMIDQQVVDRHVIVEKRNEVTTASRAERSRIQDEQVLYAAMGYSIFETLRQKNIIFEGWKDKEVFRIAADALAKTDKTIKESLTLIGLTFAEGAKDVKHVSNFLELANRGCLIISDADAPALEKRKQYTKRGAWGKWVTLRDILDNDGSVVTAEDLISQTALIKRANKWRQCVPGLQPLTPAAFDSKTHWAALSAWLTTTGLTGEQLEEVTHQLKDAIFANLRRDEIVPRADRLVTYVLQHKFQ